jgi:hypothetical protein
MSDFDPGEGLLYRMAYGLAVQLLEARYYSLQVGRHRNNPEAGGDRASIMAEVIRQLRLVDLGAKTLAAEGIDDALARRQPRW